MTASDDLRAKAERAQDRYAATGEPSIEVGSLVAEAIYLSTAALIDALPDERERAELAALTGAALCAESELFGEMVENSKQIADALLKARREGE